MVNRIMFPVILPMSAPGASTDLTSGNAGSQNGIWEVEERVALALAIFETMKDAVEDWHRRGATCSDECKLAKSDFYHARCRQFLSELTQLESDALALGMGGSRIAQLSDARQQLELAVALSPREMYEGELEMRSGQVRPAEDVRRELRARSH